MPIFIYINGRSATNDKRYHQRSTNHGGSLSCIPAEKIRETNTRGFAESGGIFVNGKPIEDTRIGINHELEGDNLVIFLFLEKKGPVDITSLPEKIF